jgi:hypothetical protein
LVEEENANLKKELSEVREQLNKYLLKNKIYYEKNKLKHRPIIFIRFNTDEYNKYNKITSSCWGIDGRGMCTIKKTKQNEWNDRLNVLSSQIEYWLNPENVTDKTVEVIQLFYDE